MIEKNLKTTEGKLRVQIPSQLNEVTLAQMMAMQDKPKLNDIEAISILSGIPLDDLYTVKNVTDFECFTDTILSISYQIKQLYNSESIPKEITFYNLEDSLSKTVNVMHNLSVEPAGAFMAARDIITEEMNLHVKKYGNDWQEHFNPSLNTCCQILAHYFYCRVIGKKYNEYNAEEFVNQVQKLRVTEALPIAL